MPDAVPFAGAFCIFLIFAGWIAVVRKKIACVCESRGFSRLHTFPLLRAERPADEWIAENSDSAEEAGRRNLVFFRNHA